MVHTMAASAHVEGGELVGCRVPLAMARAFAKEIGNDEPIPRIELFTVTGVSLVEVGQSANVVEFHVRFPPEAVSFDAPARRLFDAGGRPVAVAPIPDAPPVDRIAAGMANAAGRYYGGGVEHAPALAMIEATRREVDGARASAAEELARVSLMHEVGLFDRARPRRLWRLRRWLARGALGLLGIDAEDLT